MAKTFHLITGILFLSFVLTAVLAGTLRQDFLLSIAITLGTCFYHFAMRLTVGWTLDKILRKHLDCRKKWFQPRPVETRFYQAIRIKHWKRRIPSYQPERFSPASHTWDEIAQASCQAEIVHEVIIPLSFLPLAAAAVYGAFPVFLATSVCAACVDLIFVMLQRYNRPRILKRIRRERSSAGLSSVRLPQIADP